MDWTDLLTDWIIMLQVFLNVTSPILVLLAVFIIGKIIERRHLALLTRREAYSRVIPTNLRRTPDGSRPAASMLCMGSTVVGADAFKRFGASLKTLIGGRIRTLEGMLQRGRREALLRMREQADQFGADVVLNVRIETAYVRKYMAEIIAYGTAVKLEKDT